MVSFCCLYFVSLPPPTTFSIKWSCRKGLEICQLLTVLPDQLIPSGSHSLHTPERPLQWRNKVEHGISCSVQSCQSFLCCQSSSNYLGLTEDDTLPPESVRLPCHIHPFSKNKLMTALLKKLFPKELVQEKWLPRKSSCPGAFSRTYPPIHQHPYALLWVKTVLPYFVSEVNASL